MTGREQLARVIAACVIAMSVRIAAVQADDTEGRDVHETLDAVSERLPATITGRSDATSARSSTRNSGKKAAKRSERLKKLQRDKKRRKRRTAPGKTSTPRNGKKTRKR